MDSSSVVLVQLMISESNRGRLHCRRCRSSGPSLPFAGAIAGLCSGYRRSEFFPSLCVWAVYYKQIRKSEQRPPLHLRLQTSSHSPGPRCVTWQ